MPILEAATPIQLSYIQADWPAPPCVKAYQTTRHRELAQGAQADFSLGGSVDNDTLSAIQANRQKLIMDLGLAASPPLWLQQVHGNRVVDLSFYEHEQDCASYPALYTSSSNAQAFLADAAFSTQRARVCVVQTADCLPILLCDRAGTVVAAIHGGWRGILAGIIEITVAALPVKSTELLAWLGPAIGPSKFAVGEDVYRLFVNCDAQAELCFTQISQDKWLADLYRLAKQRLQSLGVAAIYGGNYCTYSQEELFFSYRRDGAQTGRMASLIWLS